MASVFSTKPNFSRKNKQTKKILRTKVYADKNVCVLQSPLRF